MDIGTILYVFQNGKLVLTTGADTLGTDNVFF